MGKEYDFNRGVRGRYAGRLAEPRNVIVLDPDAPLAAPYIIFFRSSIVNSSTTGSPRCLCCRMRAIFAEVLS